MKVAEIKTMPKELRDSYRAVMNGSITKEQNDRNILKWYMVFYKYKLLVCEPFPLPKNYLVPKFIKMNQKKKSDLKKEDRDKFFKLEAETKEYTDEWDKIFSNNYSNYHELKAVHKSARREQHWDFAKTLKEYLNGYSSFKSQFLDNNDNLVKGLIKYEYKE